MNDKELFLYRRLPGRLTAEQAGLLLGFLAEHVAILTSGGLLRPLGRLSPNGRAWYAAAEIESLSKDREWLERASRSVTRWIQQKNRKSKKWHHKLAA